MVFEGFRVRFVHLPNPVRRIRLYLPAALASDVLAVLAFIIWLSLVQAVKQVPVAVSFNYLLKLLSCPAWLHCSVPFSLRYSCLRRLWLDRLLSYLLWVLELRGWSCLLVACLQLLLSLLSQVAHNNVLLLVADLSAWLGWLQLLSTRRYLSNSCLLYIAKYILCCW